MRIVVVEDHASLREIFIDYLNGLGFAAVGVTCGEELDEQVTLCPADLLILDINLPGENGYQIATRMHAAYASTHIIMLTARTTELDRIEGYEAGADIYLPKPVSPAELGAAVQAIQRRRTQQQDGGGLVLDLGNTSLSTPDGTVMLGPSDAALLAALAVAPQRRLDYWRLFEVTCRESTSQAKYQLELQVHRLRKKLATIGIAKSFIRTVRYQGYALSSPLRIIQP